MKINLDRQVVMIRESVPNPILEMGTYQPTTDYWLKAIRLGNAGILTSALHGHNPKQLLRGLEVTVRDPDFGWPTTAVEWAEFVMAINHLLWMLNGLHETRGIEYLEPLLEALSDLYYKLHNEALDTLKGDDLSEYLRITD